jgi:hypothetical protein
MSALPMIALSAFDFFGQWYDWLPLTILAVMVAILINGLLFAIGKGFSFKELETFAMSEMLQAGATAFMAIFLVMMVGGAMSLVQQFIAGDVACGGTTIKISQANPSSTPTTASEVESSQANAAMGKAFDVIRCRLHGRAAEISALQGSILNDGGVFNSFNALNAFGSLFGIPVFKGDWVNSLYQETETMRLNNNLATVLLIGLNAQYALANYLQANMIQIFIPVGILLRSFYFTRSPGALMIAIGIGMYFLFPAFFIILDPGFIPAPPIVTSPLTKEQVQPYCYPSLKNTVTVLATVEGTGLGGTKALTLESVREKLAESYIALMIHPLIALSLTMVFIRYMMSVLGADTYELTKMVGKMI